MVEMFTSALIYLRQHPYHLQMQCNFAVQNKKEVKQLFEQVVDTCLFECFIFALECSKSF